jgi:hypothetical protein
MQMGHPTMMSSYAAILFAEFNMQRRRKNGKHNFAAAFFLGERLQMGFGRIILNGII